VLTTSCVYVINMNGKVYVVDNRNCFQKTKKKFKVRPRLLVVTYTEKVAISKKWRGLDTLLLHTTNRKYHMAYRLVPFAMNLNDIECHSPVAGLIKCNSTNIYATYRTVSTDMARRAFPRR